MIRNIAQKQLVIENETEDSMQQLINKLVALKVKQLDAEALFKVVPNCAIVTKNYQDYQCAANTYCRLLSKNSIVDFKGIEMYLELRLDENHIKNFNLFENEVASLIISSSDISQAFKGYLLLNMLNLKDNLDEEFILKLLFMSEMLSESLKLIFVTDNVKMIDQLSEYFCIQDISLPVLDVKDGINTSINLMKKYNITLTQEATQYLVELVEKLSDRKHFRGMETINKIIKDLIYLAPISTNGSILNGTTLQKYIADKYDENSYSVKNKRIGFGGYHE